MNLTDVVLRIVHSADLIGHEVVDGRRVDRLVQRLRSDGVLKNPPAVVDVVGKYVVLDGATRVAALRELGIRDVLVQIVDYGPPGVELHSWCHVVVGMGCQDLVDGLNLVKGIEVKSMELNAARTELKLKSIVCYVVLPDGGVLAAVGRCDLDAQVDLINEIVDLYGGYADVYRAATDSMEELLEEYPELTAVVVFPCFSPADIMSTSLDGARLPMGVTRHSISGRALGVNVDIVMLDSDIPLAQKNVWLEDLIKSRVKGKRVRFYPEAVFRFDE
jgi:hypothetical protein